MYLTMTDGFRLERDHQTSDIGSGHFLGEISFLLGSEASATIIAKPGCSYVSWNVDTLKDLMSKKPHIANAVSVLLNKDIALKLAVSFPTQGIP
jgi:CRP-like cAMP-binding protein